MKNTLKTLMTLALSFSFVSKAANLPGDSLYHIDSTWLSQDAKEVNLKTFLGKPTLLSMVYLSCAYACPTVISQIQSIEAKLDPKLRDKVQIVLVSFDPEKDTPVAMKAYTLKRKLNPSRWTLLSPQKESSVRELAAALNFKYKKDGKGDFTHSFMILALDEKGVVKARIDTADQSHDSMLEALKRLF